MACKQASLEVLAYIDYGSSRPAYAVLLAVSGLAGYLQSTIHIGNMASLISQKAGYDIL